MIEKMKQIHLLMPAIDSSHMLDKLQKLGIIHIDFEDISGRENVAEIEKELSALRKTESFLKTWKKNVPAVSDNSIGISCVSDLLKEVEKLQEKADTLHAQIDRHRKDLSNLETWPGYNPEKLALLEEAGLKVTFHILSQRAYEAADFTTRHIERIQETRTSVAFAEITEGTNSPLFSPERLPSESEAQITVRLNNDLKALELVESQIMGFVPGLELINKRIGEVEIVRERLNAEYSLLSEVDGEVSRITGYIPNSRLSVLEDFVGKEKAVISLITNPDNPEKVPIHLKNGPFNRLFEPITKIFELPSYMEIDTTPMIAPFFTLFFGFCLADVGYGFLIALASVTGILFFKTKTKRALSFLGVILGLSTMVGGVLLNSVFGIKISQLPSLPPAINSLLLFKDMDSAMALSIFLGVVQVLIGFVMQILNSYRSGGLTKTLLPTGTFMLIAGIIIWGVGSLGSEYTIGPLPIGLLLALLGNTRSVGLILVAVGIGLILFFNNLNKRIWIRPVLGLWELYSITTGVPGYILSYIRLFALSMASGLLGGTVNIISIMVRGENPNILNWTFMLVVLLFGHFINFALAALGSFVHPLRLTFVEFYQSVGFTGGGKAYTPYGGKI